MTLIAAADGSALGNPGPAGWAWYADDEHWAAGGWPHGTNNQGELTAVLNLLEQTADLDDDLVIICDSTYVINSITKWMPGWKRKGWKKGDGKPVMNVAIMQALDKAMAGRRVRFEWVKGHSGHELNEKADTLANGAALAFQRGETPDAGPGWGGVAAAAPAASVAPPDVSAQASAMAQGEPDLFSLADLERSAAEVDSSDEAQVIAAERSLLRDEVRSDPTAIAALLHQAWTEIGASGRLWSREDMLAEIVPLDPPVTLDVIACMPLADDVMALTWRSASEVGSALRTSIWKRTDGRWQQILHQGTPEPS